VGDRATLDARQPERAVETELASGRREDVLAIVDADHLVEPVAPDPLVAERIRGQIGARRLGRRGHGRQDAQQGNGDETRHPHGTLHGWVGRHQTKLSSGHRASPRPE
jgi:hypothetical protein